MDDLFSFPEIPTPREIGLLRTRRPEWSDAGHARELAGRFGIKGEAADLGSRIVVRDDVSAFELFVASGSVRWGEMRPGDAEADFEPKLPSEQAAIDRAQEHLRSVGLDHQAAEYRTVTDMELAFRRTGEDRETSWSIARQVNFGFAFGRLPFFGPGAKTQVSLGHEGVVLGAYRFWREAEVAGEATTIEPDRVVNVLRHDETFSELRAGESSVRFHNCQLGYYALPPREVQRVLLPVFALDGVVSTPDFERYEFTRYVPAVPSPPKPEARDRGRLQAVAAF